MVQWYLEYEYWVAVVQLVLAMLGMGAGLRVSDFQKVVLQPKAVNVGLLMQLVIVPLVAFGFIVFTNLPAGMIIGIAIIAAIPGGTSSNIFTFMARGNVPLSISITALTSVACLVTTPLILDFLIAEYMPDSFTMPTLRIAIEIGLCLLLPLLLGMVVLRRFPYYAGRFSTICVRGSLLGIALIAAGSIGAGRLNIGDTPSADLVTLLGFIIGLTVIGVGLTKAFGLAQQDNTAIEMEVVVRNINLGLLLKVSLFPLVVGEVNALADMVLLSLLLYGAWQLIMGFALIFWRRNSTKGTTQTVTSA